MHSFGKQGARTARGASILGTIAFLAIFAVLALFGYRVWYYASQIRKGEIVDLPQYRSAFTVSADQPTLSGTVVPRDQVETADNPELGVGKDGDAKLTIVQFGDFECPFSASEHEVVRRMMAKYGDKVRFIYRDYPIGEIHPNARAAAMAAECAREQGKFWAMHDKLYANQSALGFQDLLRHGAEIGLDGTQFETCLIDERYASKVDADVAAAKAFGLRGTPTFFFDGQRVEGAIPEDILDRIVSSMTK